VSNAAPSAVRDQIATARRVFSAAKDAARVKATAIEPMTLEAFRERYKSEQGFFDFCDLLEIKPKEAEGGVPMGSASPGRIPFRLNKIQRAYCLARSPRDVILKARQVTITSVELARDVWYFLTKLGVSVVVVCQSSSDNRMVNELNDRIGVIFDSLKKNAGLTVKFTSESKTEWSLTTGSNLSIVTSGASEKAAQKKVRGETVHRIHTTELAFWEHAGQTLNAMLEAIVGPEFGTEIVHESTPNGAGGGDRMSAKSASGGPLFYWYCQDARTQVSAFKFHFFSWLDKEEYRTPLKPGEVIEPENDREHAVACLGAGHEQLKWYRDKVIAKGQDDTDQEYASDPETCFLVSGRACFDKAVTGRLIANVCAPLGTVEIRRSGAVGTCKVWNLPVTGRRYVVAADTSEGTGGDAGSGQVWESDTGRHMATLWGQFKPEELARDLDCLGTWYNRATVAVERNNHGHACLYALADVYHYRNVYNDRDDKPGWYNVENKRVAAIDKLEQAHRTGEWECRDIDILGEFRTFIINKDGKAEAARGAKDDLVLTAVIAWDVLSQRNQSIPIRPQPTPKGDAARPRFGGSGGGLRFSR
jgi:hypothetical protein